MTDGDGIKAKPNVSFKRNNIGHFPNSNALCPQLSSRGQQNRVMKGRRDGMRGVINMITVHLTSSNPSASACVRS